MNYDVFILSGPSGAGKTTLARLAQKKAEYIFSVDDFFSKGGGYKFNPDLLDQAHNGCLANFISTCKEVDTVGCKNKLYVDNTNCSAWELAPYYRIAEAYGLRPAILMFQTGLGACIDRSIHGVPGVAIQKQADCLFNLSKNLPTWWEVWDILSFQKYEYELCQMLPRVPPGERKKATWAFN